MYLPNMEEYIPPTELLIQYSITDIINIVHVHVSNLQYTGGKPDWYTYKHACIPIRARVLYSIAFIPT